jgi:hypothetical protein
MNPIVHPSNNHVFGPPEAWDHGATPCDMLSVTLTELEGLPVIASYWQPDEQELAALAQGKPVILFVHSQSHPVVDIGVEA